MTDEQKQAVARLEKTAADMVEPQRLHTAKAVGNDIQTLLQAVREMGEENQWLLTELEAIRFRAYAALRRRDGEI